MLQLFGRAEAAARVRQAMTARGRANPVLVFEGPPGSGKTSLLDALEELLHSRVPNVLLDVDAIGLDADRGARGAIPAMVADLAFQLARHAGGYGTLPFPRLTIGFLVQRLDLDRVDRAQARRTVDDALRAHRGVDRWTTTLGEAAGQLVAAAPGGRQVPPTLIERILAGVVGLFGRWGPGRRFLLGPYQQWYGHQDLGITDPAIEALVGLKRWSETAPLNPDNQRRIDDLLLRAFLADLRDAFRRAERSGGWSFNAVLLLDNVDGELGQAFLTELVRIRRDVQAGGTAGQDPLTVVVTSRGALLTEVEDRAAGDLAGRSARRDAAAREQFWQRVPLPALTHTEISAMIAQLALSDGNTQHLATVVHEFTRGHAAATELLLGAVDDRGRADVELAVLLREPADGEPLERQLLARLLAGVEAGSLRDLELCAAARSPEPVKRMVRKLALNRSRGGPEKAPLWTPDDQEVALVRRLLLRRLAARVSRWNQAFETLRDDAVDQQNADLELYYKVGLGEWGEIAAALTEQLKPGAVPDWLDGLHRIAAAPARPLRGTAPAADGRDPDTPWPVVAAPDALAQALAKPFADGEPRYRTVLHLLTALSVARDPLCGRNRGELYRRIAEYYRELSEYPNLGCDELDVLERRYLRLARDWHPLPTTT